MGARKPVRTVLLLWLVAASCGGGAEEVRRHTYASSFRYLSDAEIRTAMGSLARDVIEMNRVLRSDGRDGGGWAGVGPGPRDAAEPGRVVAILDRMRRTAARLEAPALATNHPELGQGIEAFRRDLDMARHGAALDPPQLFLAGTITGGCLYCHGR